MVAKSQNRSCVAIDSELTLLFQEKNDKENTWWNWQRMETTPTQIARDGNPVHRLSLFTNESFQISPTRNMSVQ